MLAYTGCCISEALALGENRVDLEEGVTVFETPKKRRLAATRRAGPRGGTVVGRIARGTRAA
jgi:integrase